MIIGFTGAARAGKNEAANVLIEMFGAKHFSFAEPIRSFVINFLQLSGLEELDEIKEVPNHLFGGKTPRYVMQKMGTEFGREMIDSNIWVNRCIEMANRVDISVISDVRFDNEAQALKNADSLIFKIVRPNNVGTKLSEHASEKGIDEKYIDGVIVNDGDLIKFRQEVYRVVYEHLS